MPRQPRQTRQIRCAQLIELRQIEVFLETPAIFELSLLDRMGARRQHGIAIVDHPVVRSSVASPTLSSVERDDFTIATTHTIRHRLTKREFLLFHTTL